MPHTPASRFVIALAFVMLAGSQMNAWEIGIFEEHTDVGATARKGNAVYDSTSQTLLVTGGGENMWGAQDAFHFVWRKMSGDVSLSADITFAGAGGNTHRKACLIIRQSLTPDAAYADIALHGDGLTCLQYRESSGGLTREVQSLISHPQRLRIEKRGGYVSMSVAPSGEPLQAGGGSVRLEFQDPFYVGLAVCAHDNKTTETARFSTIELQPAAPLSTPRTLISALETISIDSGNRRTVFVTTNLIEAPNWSRDGQLIYNSRGRLWRIPATGGEPKVIDTDFATRCNNDHGISPDGTGLVISDQSQGDRRSRIYTLPIGGGTPKLVTGAGPSYWHGWSPDGRTLAYCAERNGEYDVYTIPIEGGVEKRLTDAPGLDDGPDYSPDGQWIYFNSDRTGRMQVWRMKPDGAGQEQMTTDDYNDWFPHPSPDGRRLVFLSYEPEVKGHPANQDVLLRLMSLPDGKVTVLARIFGGQGTINVPSWSPDSRQLAFVSYQLR